MTSHLFQRFEQNTQGHDYVVGDIHGRFDLLENGMALVRFNPWADRLFSVGDLVDRGPRSAEAQDWLREPWFHAVRGNHEQMCIESDPGMHLVNGGAWFLALDEKQQEAVRAAFDELPIAIEIAVGDGIVGIVHAEVPGDDWPAFRTMLQAPPAIMDHIESFALWGRDVIRRRAPVFAGVTGVTKVYVGHTPLEQTLAIENVHYIDTGAVFGRALTIVNMHTGSVTRVPA